MKTLHYINNLDEKNINRYKSFDKFPESIKEQLLEKNSYPIIESKDEHKLFVLILPVYIQNKETIELIECDLVIGPEDIFVISEQEHESINAIIEQTKKDNRKSPTLYRFILSLCNHILKEIHIIEKTINIFKQSTIEEEGYTTKTINTIMKLKLTIGMFKSTISPLSDVIAHMTKTIEYKGGNLETYNHQIKYLTEQIKSQSIFLYENISIVSDTSNAIQNITSNTIMKILTIISSIFIPLSFITGFFGMNFQDIPIENTTVYYITILGMIFIGSSQLYVFKKKKRF